MPSGNFNENLLNAEKVFWIDAIGHTGLGYYDKGITDYLSNHKHVSLFVPSGYLYINEKKDGVGIFDVFGDYYNNKNKILKGLGFVIGYLKILLCSIAQKPKAIHVQISVLPIAEIIFFLFFRILGLKVIFTPHDIVKFYSRKYDFIAISILYHLSNRIVAHSCSDADMLRSEFRINSGKIEVIPHGNYIFEEGCVDADTAKKRLSINSDRRVILFFGTIRKQKGLDYLLRGYKKVTEKDATSILLVAGKPQQVESVEYEDLIGKLGISSRVILRPYFIAKEDVKYYYSAAEFLVLPYVEGYATGVGQMAYSYKKPIIVTRLPPFVETFGGDADFVRWIDPGDEDDIAQAILEWLAVDRKGLVAKGNKGHEILQQRYPWARAAEKTNALYDGLG